jgi:hypothetical protein
VREALQELASAPWWVQVGLSGGVAFVLYGLLGHGFKTRRYTKRFRELARAFGQDGADVFTTEVAGRQFEVKCQYRTDQGPVGTVRGPYGYLLVTTTSLRSPRWELHGVDFEKGNVRLHKALGHALTTTGDAKFDAQFIVREDGVPVRENWLDAPARAAIVRFYELPESRGTTWIQEAKLSHLIAAPWKGINESSLRELMTRQAALATELERTAR